MKLSTMTISTIEMTREEADILWDTPQAERRILGAKVCHWITAAGRIEIRLEGEDIYRRIIYKNI